MHRGLVEARPNQANDRLIFTVATTTDLLPIVSPGVAALMVGVLSVVSIHLASLDVMPLLYGFIGFFSTFIAGIILGFIFPSTSEEVDGLTLFTQKK